MNRIFFRYCAKKLLNWFCIISAVVLLVVLFFDASELMRRTAKYDHITFWTVIRLTLTRLPHLYTKLVPFIILIAGMISIWRMNRINEITIARATGMSLARFLAPFVLMAGFIGLVDVFAFNPFAANLYQSFDLFKQSTLQQKTSHLSVEKTGIWLRYSSDRGTVIFRVDKISAKDQSVDKMSIFEYTDDQLSTRIDAEKAFFSSGGLQMNRVWSYPLNGTPHFYKKGFYSSDILFKDFYDGHRSPDSLSVWSLPSYINKIEKSGLSSIRYQVHFHALFSRVLWFMGMILLAASCTIMPLRGRSVMRYILPAILAGFVFYIIRDISTIMGRVGAINVIFAAWIPALLTVFIGLTALIIVED